MPLFRVIRIFFLLVFALLSLVLSAGDGQGLVPLRDPVTDRFVPLSYAAPRVRVMLPRQYFRKPCEMRGVWVATIGNVDFQTCKTAKEFRQRYSVMMKKLADAGFNTVFFQVRPSNDAFYESKLNPWSRYLTGTEGMSLEPGFDPLSYMIAAAHMAGLEFHAWVNPYRVAGNIKDPERYMKTLSPLNFARKHPNLVLTIPDPSHKKRYLSFLNPGEPEVQLFFLSTIREILEKYDVDGIHIDDYFYPYGDIGSLDKACYEKYRLKNETPAQWRMRNINNMIRYTGRLIRRYNYQYKKNVRFGVSPFGVWANKWLTIPKGRKQNWWDTLGSLTKSWETLTLQYADTRLWVKMGWIDYIIPQIYWGFTNTHAPYAAVVKWWAETVRGTNVDLYLGIGIYRMGVAKDTLMQEELPNQILYGCLYPEVKGVCFYSSRNVLKPDNAVMKQSLHNVISGFWHKKTPF